MLVVLFVIMSSKKNSRKRLCPGSKLAAPAHFGLLNKFCTRPGRKESEDGAEAIDTAKVSPISAQCNPVQPTAELLQAVRLLSNHWDRQNTAGTDCSQRRNYTSGQGISRVLSLQQRPASHFHQVIMNKYIYQGFWCFARSRSHEIQVNPRNPAKFTKTRKISRNSVEILSNACLYSNFETCLSYWGYLLAVSSQIYEQRSETTRRRLCCEKLGTSHDVKGFAIGSFLECIVVERANDVLC